MRVQVMRDRSVILTLRRDMPKVFRFHRASEKLAGWCSWRCPLFAFLLVLAAHLVPTPPWWRASCHVLVAISIALLFCSVGVSMAATAFLVERRRNWIERVGLVAGMVGGAALVVIGLIGGWALISRSVGGS
jgi:hypothetical protein